MNRTYVKEFLYPILDDICKEYGYEWGEVTDINDAPNVLRIHFADLNKHCHLSHVFRLRDDTELGYESRSKFINDIREALDNWRSCNPNLKPQDEDVKKYIKVKLLDEILYRRFDGLCNEVNFENPIYLICNHRYENGSCYTLAMIPHSRVEIIKWEEDDE